MQKTRQAVLCLFLLLFVGSLQAQEFSVPVTVTDGENTLQLNIGMSAVASDTFDVGIDALAPPPPPSEAFDARLKSNGNDFITDIRASSTDTTTFQVYYQPELNKGPIKLTWDKDALALLGTFYITDNLTGTVFGPVDMTQVDSLIADNAFITEQLRIVVIANPVLDPPANLNAVGGNGVVDLSWLSPAMLQKLLRQPKAITRNDNENNVLSDDNAVPAMNVSVALLGYKIFRSDDGSTFSQIDSIGAPAAAFADSSVINGTTYSYYLTAVYDEGESVPSDTVSATPEAPVLNILFEEVFADTTAPPTGWQVIDNDGSGGSWDYVQGLNFSSGVVLPQAGQSFWHSSFQNANGFVIDEWLISPRIPAANFETLSFYAGSIGGSFPDSLKVLVSTTGSNPADFTEIAYFQVPGPTGSWTEFSFDISAFSGSAIYVAINYYITDGGTSGTNSDNVWVDHLTITGEAIPPDVVFADDFENGSSNWMLQSTWAVTDESSSSPTHSLTESPGGNYAANLNISATLATSIDLSSYFSAELSFNAQYDIEQGFDYMYVEASDDGGSSWIELDVFDGTSPTWQNYSYALSGVVGSSDVKIRFRFTSDGGFEVDGMHIDDVMITASSIDADPPLIVHTGPAFYAGVSEAFVREAEVIDISGVSATAINYMVDGDTTTSAASDSTVGDVYFYTIPEQPAGANVAYYFSAEDNAGNATTETTMFEYIAGDHLIFDNGVVDFVNSFGPGSTSGLLGAAVRISVPEGKKAQLTTALIRNYTDVNRPNSDMLLHVWADNGGVPGTDLITPITVMPEATLENTSPMTRVDLRSYAAELSDLLGDFFIGFTVPSGEVWVTQTTPGTFGRTFTFNGTSWGAETDDYHFRAVVKLDPAVGIEDDQILPVQFTLEQNYPNPFNPSTTLKYALPTNADVRLEIYNVLGQLVKVLVDADQTAGFKTAIWDGTNQYGEKVASGIYIYRIKAAEFVQSKKMILMK